MKKLLCSLLAAVMLLGALPAVSLAAEETVSVVLDGTTLAFDVPPTVVNGRTLVPMRTIFTALGADVTWDDAAQTAISTKGTTTVRIGIGNPSMTVSGTTIYLDTPAMLISGRTMVPLRAVSNAFGATVEWDGAANTVILSSTEGKTPAGIENLSAADKDFYLAALQYTLDLIDGHDLVVDALQQADQGYDTQIIASLQSAIAALDNANAATYHQLSASTTLGVLRSQVDVLEACVKSAMNTMTLTLQSAGYGDYDSAMAYLNQCDVSMTAASVAVDAILVLIEQIDPDLGSETGM